MYALIKGTIAEVQDTIAGEKPFVKNVYDAEGKATPTLYKVKSVKQFLGLAKLSDECYTQAIECEAEEWKDDEGSSDQSSGGSDSSEE